MAHGIGKYSSVYAHLWRTYGQSGLVRVSFAIFLVTRICKLIILPVAVSIIITKLSIKDFDAAYQGVWLFVGTSLVIGILSPLTKYVGMLGENKVYDRATGEYFSKLVNADIDYFHSNLAGYLTAATRQYVDSCIQLVRALRDRYMTTVLSILFPLVVIMWLDVWLGLVALALSIVQAAYLIWASHAITPFRTQARELYRKNSGRMADVIGNILAVRSTAQESSYIEQIRAGAHKESHAFERRYAMQAKLTGVREFITVGFFLVLLWLTVLRMSAGFIDITAAVLVATYTFTILTGIYALSDDLDQHDDLVDKIIPAFEVLERKNNVQDPLKPKKLGKAKGSVSFQGVNFAYENGRSVLSDFSVDIPAGQKVGVVGLSGAGKSTLTKLLLRFNDVSDGRILIDGTDVRDVMQTDLRAQIAYVPQEPLLFHTTVKENVLVANPKATDAEVRRALKMAHAWQFVQHLPDGMDSIVGERGVKLSGGQKQRIAIARAVLRHAPIMILDEATSALDSESEQIIKNSFTEILEGRTAVVIAHRLSTLSHMDRIIVIENGQCAEDGTHDELLAENGIYAQLWRRQQKYTDVESSVIADPAGI